ncbi:HNH endonuclease signature motif containing protein [Archangium sp.]|uniref:HNH endonuclease n=1 Tax=Archangium sp. TaxID=1872627 RepID=UPI00286D6369|nr:HNH endonuclease signature motif containing protein [Archangium sp.]
MVLSLGSEREYAGNVGYDDELERVYRYDSLVPNHLQIAEGDLLILRDGESVLGTARASTIVSKKGTKELSRCPECNVTTIKVRKDKLPRYRCKEGHEFETPVVTQKSCVHFAAWFDGTFRPSPRIPVEQVRQACPRYNGQLAMQELVLESLEGEVKLLLQGVAAKSMAHSGIGLVAADAVEEPYVPDGRDDRKIIERQIRERRGQATFRRELRLRFGDTCVVTGCKLPDLLEAAHINPHRGDKDNHPSNGLLLRADIHTLFDLDLLGFEPATLQVSLHPKLRGMGYDHLAGTSLSCGSQLPSRDALESRWKKFESGL